MKKYFLLLLAALLSSAAYASPSKPDFCEDGIYFHCTSAYSVEVTCDPDDPYTGNIVIPETVTRDGTEYSVTAIGQAAFKDMAELLSVEMPNSIETIGGYAFECSTGITSINLPNSVTSIGKYAFRLCSGLTLIDIPNSVTSIGGGAFACCKHLVTFTGNYASDDGRCLIVDGVLNSFAPAGLTSYEIPSSVTSIGSYAFYGCSSLTSVEIPNSVTTISDFVFSHCSSLTSVVIPNSVTSIGGYAFSNCSSLSTVEIPSSVTTIGVRILVGCSSLESITGKYASEDNRCLIVNGELNSFAPAGLTAYEIPNSVTSIGHEVFKGFSGLTSVVIPNSVTSIGHAAFESCSGLTSVVISNSVTSIDERAFWYCSDLASVEIPNSVTSIGNSAFRGCSSLTSIVIPNSVTAIGEMAFSACSGLTSVVIPNSVTAIGEMAFYACSGLTSVVIPNSVTSIGNYAFGSCSGLIEITCLNTTPPTVDDRCFNNVPTSTCVLKVPYESVDAYKAAEGWSEFQNIVAIPENLMAVADAEVRRGTSFNLPIEMMSLKPMSGFQFHLSLPEGMSVTKASTTERSADLITPMGNMVDNVYMLSAFNTGAEAIESGEGAVLELKVTVDGEMEPGEYEITLSDIIMFGEDGEEIKPADRTATLTVKAFTLGDVNDNGEINTGDAIAIVNHVIRKPQAVFVVEAADINGNGEVNTGDAIALVNFLIHKTSSLRAPSRMNAPKQRAAAGNSITIGGVEATVGESAQIPISFNNEKLLSGFEFDVALPEGVTLTKNVLGERAKDGDGDPLITISSNFSDGVYKYSVIPTGMAPISGYEGEVFYLDVKVGETVEPGDYEVTITSAKFFTEDGDEPSVADATGTLTVVGDTPLPEVILDENSTEEPEASDGKVNVTMNRTIAAGVWNTICLPFAMNESQIKAAFGEDVEIANFTGEAMKDGAICISFEKVPASAGMANSHPYIIKTSSSITQFKVQNVEIAPDDYARSVETGAKKKKSYFTGIFKKCLLDTDDEYLLEATTILFLSNNKFYYSTGNTWMKGFRAFFDLYDTIEDDGAACPINLVVDDDVTAIEVVDGSMLVPVNDKAYNLSGQRVGDSYRGIVIKNGKKFINK